MFGFYQLRSVYTGNQSDWFSKQKCSTEGKCGVVWCGVCVGGYECVYVCHMHVRVHVLDVDRNRLLASTSRASVVT